MPTHARDYEELSDDVIKSATSQDPDFELAHYAPLATWHTQHLLNPAFASLLDPTCICSEPTRSGPVQSIITPKNILDAFPISNLEKICYPTMFGCSKCSSKIILKI